MKLSVIIPVFNCERYLKECLESVRVQTMSDFEVICVDDGSTDNTAVILDEFAALDKRFKVIHQANGGQGKARNTGIDNAKGDYIAFVDADDWVDKNFLELLVTNVEAKMIPVVGLAIELPNQTICRGSEEERTITGRDEILRAFVDGEVDVYLKRKRFAFPGGYLWNKLFPRELFEGVSFDEVGIMEDVRMFLRLIDKGVRIKTIKAYPYHYRQHDESRVHDMSFKTWKEGHDTWVLLAKSLSGISRWKALFLILVHFIALYRRILSF